MQRLDEILKLVSHLKIDVNSLSEKLQVSKVTIRKDLDKLESSDWLHREHGYAVLNSEMISMCSIVPFNMIPRKNSQWSGARKTNQDSLCLVVT